MRNLNALDIDRFRDRSRRVVETYGNVGDETCGVFNLPSPIDSANLHIVASQGGGWDHVSVSRVNRCPNWPEMCRVKDLFFSADECVIQYHPPASAYVNNHPHCLHLWKPQSEPVPMPAEWMV